MIGRPKLILILAIFFIVNTSLVKHKEIIESNQVIALSLKAIKEAKSLSYTLKNTERINNKLLSGIQQINYVVSPFKCSIYMVSPNKGAKLLYLAESVNKKAVYKPNQFPFMPLYLEPLGSVMRKNNHHTIFEVGFSSISNLMLQATEFKKYKIELKGSIEWNNLNCYELLLTNSSTTPIAYSVKESETVRSIAKKQLVSEYRIIELNKLITSFDTKLTVGQKIIIPSNYASSIIIYIDKINKLPVYQSFSDDLGLLEQYEYSKLVVNPIFRENEFNLKEFIK